ncbi:hypothetical protein [Rathayibacter sp. AY1C5]|jgi:hypothetical protein|uniref:hypothetical protein n=1 Tax=Rathayibacter sp. AY1C5 TaxID=2080538 RepID=UPI0011B0F2A1|nr:hypothetical protein [Rathayibacter sp. AY1C5]
MVQIPDQPAKTNAAAEDLLLIRDVAAGTDKRVTVGGLRSAMHPVTVDANGWTKLDMGTFSIWKKRVTYSMTTSAGGSYTIPISSSNLPTGMATLGNNTIQGSMIQLGSAFNLNWNFEMSSASTGLAITAYALITGTPSGSIEIVIIGVN